MLTTSFKGLYKNYQSKRKLVQDENKHNEKYCDTTD